MSMKKLFLSLACAAFASQMFLVSAYEPGEGDGLNGAYWKGATNFDQDEPELFWAKRPQGTHATKMFDRIDKVIDFEWGNANPFDETETDFAWSIEWTGYILAPVTSLYTFDMTHWDDGYYLAIYDLANTDEPIAHSEFWGTDFKWDDPSWTCDVDLEGGKYYKVVLRHYENEFGAHASFKWFIWEDSSSYVVVPQSQLFSKLPDDAGVADALESSINVVAVDNMVQVNGLNATNVQVYNAAGQLEFSRSNVSGELNVELPRGLHIVKAGTEVKKVVVR